MKSYPCQKKKIIIIILLVLSELKWRWITKGAGRYEHEKTLSTPMESQLRGARP